MEKQSKYQVQDVGSQMEMKGATHFLLCDVVHVEFNSAFKYPKTISAPGLWCTLGNEQKIFHSKHALSKRNFRFILVFEHMPSFLKVAISF